MLSNKAFSVICKKYNVSCVFFDRTYNIIEYTNNLENFICDKQKVKTGIDLREVFWEFIGFEEKLEDLFNDKKEYIHIPMFSRGEIFYDINIETCFLEAEEKVYIAMFIKHSKSSTDYFNTIQKINHEILNFENKKENMKTNERNYNLINQKLISFHIDCKGLITKINKACSNFFQLSENQMKGCHFSKFFFSREIDGNSKSVSSILRAVDINGKDVFFHTDMIHSNNENLKDNIVICQNITYLKKVESELEFAVNHDTLTGLPNRNMFTKKLEQSIFKSSQKNIPFGICFIDLDKFKLINDNFGHHVGDIYLKHVGNVLSKTLREGDLIARVGGDEFVIILECENGIDDIEKTTKRLKQISIQKPLYYNEEIVIPIEFSLGVSIYPKHGKNADELLIHADKEMYLNKKNKYI